MLSSALRLLNNTATARSTHSHNDLVETRALGGRIDAKEKFMSLVSGERASRRACLLWRNCLIRKVTSVCSDTYTDVSRICRHYCLTDN